MQRETKEIKTPSGVDVTIYTYLTGGEMRDLQRVLLKGVEIADMTNPAPDLKGFKAETMLEAQDYLLKVLVVSVNGITDNIGKTILDMRQTDTQFILDALNSISGEWNDKKK